MFARHGKIGDYKKMQFVLITEINTRQISRFGFKSSILTFDIHLEPEPETARFAGSGQEGMLD